MKFQGKFINEKGEEVTRWFEFPTEESFKEHLSQRGWKVVKYEETKKIYSSSPYEWAYRQSVLKRLNNRQRVIFVVGLVIISGVGFLLRMNFLAQCLMLVIGVCWVSFGVRLGRKNTEK